MATDVDLFSWQLMLIYFYDNFSFQKELYQCETAQTVLPNKSKYFLITLLLYFSFVEKNVKIGKPRTQKG